MIAESLRSQIKAFSTDERHELAGFLAKLGLESNEDYWERVRRRMADESTEKWVPADPI